MLSWTGRAGGFTGPIVGSGDLLFVAACVAGGLVAAVAGCIVGLPSLRLRGDYLAIVTLGFGEIVRVLLQGTNDQIKRAADGAGRRRWYCAHRQPRRRARLHRRARPTPRSSGSIVWVAIVLIVAVRLKYSSYGRALLSIREDEIAAEAMGVNVTRYKVRAFVLAAFFAGVAGALFAMQVGSINAGDLGFQRSLRDRHHGRARRARLDLRRGCWPRSSSPSCRKLLRIVAEYRMIIYALLLILMMIVRPQGLFGVREVWDFFRRRRRRATA